MDSAVLRKGFINPIQKLWPYFLKAEDIGGIKLEERTDTVFT